ncbi:MAG: 2-oxo acid dehydrogenase subunit E2 [Actinobacteria bacterium]|nr:2-oxo acid dehydrogenase subunit E2 [Actinomycetota bacterium]
MMDVVMPRLSDSMEEGTVLKWLKSVGDEVAVGDELVEIETDKANMVYEAPDPGTLVEIVAEEGATLAIGEVIARVGDAGEVPSSNGDGAGAASEDGGAAPGAAEGGGATPPAATTDGASPGRVKASPIARRIARDRGIDLAALAGSGPGGRVIKSDVERAVAAADAGGGTGGGPAVVSATPGPPPAAAPAAASAAPTPGASEKPETAKGTAEVVELSKLQQTVSRRMAESKATAPHFYLQAEIDMTSCVDGRERLKASAKAAPGRVSGPKVREAGGMPEEAAPVVPTYNDMVVKACALALREFPRANGAYRDGRIELYSRVNVGVAVAAQDALVVPTLFDADLKGLRQISAETRALAARVRSGEITPPELSGGTFTVSNLGMYGVSNFHAVINTPQAGILAVGELKQKPAVVDDEVVPRHLMGVTLACDHRILYGADGAQFLARVRALLEEPLGLAL